MAPWAMFLQPLACVVVLLLAVWWSYGDGWTSALPGSSAIGQKTMLAAAASGYGKPEHVLSLNRTDIPHYRASEVLVEVHAASLNPADYKLMAGLAFLIDPLRRSGVGFDFSGLVVAAGASCHKVKRGDKVFGMTYFHKTGSLAEFLAVDEEALALMPTRLSFVQAAAIPLVSLTSYTSLVHFGGMGAGKRVLVLGGGSSTGRAAIQIARNLGASFIAATASPRSEQAVREFGAMQVIDYQSQDVFQTLRAQEQTFDIIYDTIAGGRAVWEGASAGALASGGQLVTITGDHQDILTPAELLRRGFHLLTRKAWLLFYRGGAGYHMVTQFGGTSDLEVIAGWVQEGRFNMTVEKEFPFELTPVREAFNHLMTGRAQGKILVKIRPQ